MIKCKELKMKFETKEELFDYLSENKAQLIDKKKSKVLKSYKKGIGLTVGKLNLDKIGNAEKGLFSNEDYYYLAVNSTNILDSHKDLHVPKIWNKSVREQQGKNYLVLDHDLSLSSTVVKKANIKMFVTTIPFSAIGKKYEGNTEVLIYKFKKTDIINKKAKEWLESGDDIEASVRMRYVKIEMAMNSEAENYKQEKKVYDKHINQIANKSEFKKEIEYFWVVKEAMNLGESSLVLFGSNGATGMVSEKKKEKKLEEVKESQNIIDFLVSNENKKESLVLESERLNKEESSKKPPKIDTQKEPSGTNNKSYFDILTDN